MTKNEPVARGKMAPHPGSKPGLETDGHGNVIPLEQRTEEDRVKARNAGEESHSLKNPEHEAENPAPMPAAARPISGSDESAGARTDPAGQQGGTRGGGRG